MTRLSLPAALALLVALAACQAPPTPPVTAASPSGVSPSASASPSASPGAGSVSPSQPAVQNRVLVTGNVYDDEGGALEGARIEVKSDDRPELNRTIEAFGGSYSIADVPAGTILRLRAFKDGYTAREQLVRAEAVPYGAEFNPNIHDFGGTGNGMLFALSKFPEITITEPANGALNGTSPLKITFRLSNPLSSRDQLRFASLLQVYVPEVPGGPTPNPSVNPNKYSGMLVQQGTGYRDKPATVTWDETGTIGTFQFDAPIVTYNGSNPRVTVAFNQAAPLDEWPQDRNGRLLGRERVAVTAEGTGAEVKDQIAPFLRSTFPTRPSAKPNAAGLWGLTHSSTVSFSLALDTTRPRVKEVRGIKGANGAIDRIFVTFDRPMRGYPDDFPGAVNHHNSVLKSSNYRFVLGTNDEEKDLKRFESLDPKTQGTPPDNPQFGSNSDTIVVLPLSVGTLGDNALIKVFVDESVSDISGNPIQSSPQDPVTHLADHVLQGVIQ